MAAFLAAFPPLAWVWWDSTRFFPAFCLLALGVFSWNIFRAKVSGPQDKGGTPWRVFLDLSIAAIGLWLYGEITLRMETGNVFGAVLTLGITAPVLLLSALALRTYVLGRIGR